MAAGVSSRAMRRPDVGTRLAQMSACPVPSTSSCCSRASPSAERSGRWSSSPGGSSRRASVCTSRASTARPPARRGPAADPHPRVPGAGVRQPGGGRPSHQVRVVVPVDRPGDRPHLRPLREHLRPARRGAGRCPRAHRQSPRDSHRRQVAREAAGAAPGLSRRARRGGQLERRGRSARARRRPVRQTPTHRQRSGHPRVSFR